MSKPNRSERLRITEIFYSIQGESNSVGWPTVFVRLTGCPLRCQYCDTAYAFHGGDWRDISDVIDEVASYKPRYVTVTGGEPLAQRPCLKLLEQLCDAGYQVSLETSGAIDLATVDPRVVKVMDLKTPGSKEVARNRWQNLEYLNEHDQIKFVLCSRQDFDWMCQQIAQHELDRWQVLASPSADELDPRDLAEWVLADRPPIRMQLQLHKFIWGDVAGH
ncbi:MAG: 7-carboxy-7-deazaguanine synthase [Lysobacteraceae bacterium]|nr:MAG: 7-carboxy-7-deazaguanine synthase [Xanthomonadaceae bacterium]